MKLLKTIKETRLYRMIMKSRIFVTSLMITIMFGLIIINYLLFQIQPTNMVLSLLIMGVFFALDINNKN